MPRLSFALRDVFWLTLVVGMGVGWWIADQRWRDHFESEQDVWVYQATAETIKRIKAESALQERGPVGQP